MGKVRYYFFGALFIFISVGIYDEIPWSWQTETYEKNNAVLSLELYHDVNPIWWRRMSVREQFIVDLRHELQRLGWKRRDRKDTATPSNERPCRIWIQKVGTGFDLLPEYKIMKWFPAGHRKALGFETLGIETSGRMMDLEKGLQENECSR